MTQDHIKRAAELSLTLHETPLERAHEPIQPTTPADDPDTNTDNDDTPEPSPYTTRLTTEEGP